jgi:hypothetical protein
LFVAGRVAGPLGSSPATAHAAPNISAPARTICDDDHAEPNEILRMGRPLRAPREAAIRDAHRASSGHRRLMNRRLDHSTSHRESSVWKTFNFVRQKRHSRVTPSDRA